MGVILLMNPEKLGMDDFIQQEDKPKDPNTGEETSALTAFEWDWPPKSVKKGSVFVYQDNTLMITPDCKIWKDSVAVKDVEKGKALLAHEQLHYDVIHAIGRVLVKKLAALTAKTAAGLETEAWKLLDYHFLKRGPLIHKAYDKETRHGLEKEQQKVWATMIKQTMLNKSALQINGWWL